ncbi:MAG: DUF937 domain-containing protein [Acidobacteria bacterium]|nr:DUF937 domain-containing protein [Acidobacteriota bacterium]
MNLLETLLNAQDGGAVRQIAGRFSLDESQAQSAISALLPALAGGLQNNVSREGGMDALLGALGGGNHQRYIDDPSTLDQDDAISEGNGILGHLLGSKDVSRQVASSAAEQTGVDNSILKQMLPIVATLVMGALSKQTATAQETPPQDNVLGLIGSVLGGGQSGGQSDLAGGVLGLMGKLFQR